MNENFSNSKELVAPCVMNCAICSGYLALKHEVKTKEIRMPTVKVVDPEERFALF